MGKFLDFEAIKREYSIEDAAVALKLAMKPGNNQLRGPCPVCKSGGDRALCITPAKSVFYCFAASKGGDQIALVAHILGVSVKDAAEWLSGNGTVEAGTVPGTVPESARGEKGARTLEPLAYLEHDHEAVTAVGFDPEVAKAIGAGYAPKGLMRGTVAIPIRDERGILLGYVGVTEARLPPAFSGNVYKFPKSA